MMTEVEKRLERTRAMKVAVNALMSVRVLEREIEMRNYDGLDDAFNEVRADINRLAEFAVSESFDKLFKE